MKIFYFILLFSALNSCFKKHIDVPNENKYTKKEASITNNTEVIGGGCDGCELMYVDMPSEINFIDTSDGWSVMDVQKLLITGTVYKIDGKTPAPNVILYYWHTNQNGLYTSTKSSKAEVHGDLRGWIKTNEKGQYQIYTLRPNPYPNDISPAHIHFSIKEPELPNEYYPDDLVFDDDPLLIPFIKKYPSMNRGGSGIVRILIKEEVQVAEHDIVLGLNVPNYPDNSNFFKQAIESGPSVGEDQPSFIPYHIFGPDQYTTTCPVCKYGRYHGIIFFSDFLYVDDELITWIKFFEKETLQRKEQLKAYMVFNTNADKSDLKIKEEIEKIGKELKLKYTALTIVPSWKDQKTEIFLNKINPKAKNTIVIYKHRSIVAKFVNLGANEKNFSKIKFSLDAKNDFFDLPELKAH
jgi:protocatechuate 3,4-dioxygenase beta subunit